MTDTSTIRAEYHNLHGTGDELCEVYYLVPTPDDPWRAVTDIPCPVKGCGQTVVWYEAGYVPGYRVCMARIDETRFERDSLHHRFLVGHDLTHPVLIREE